MMPSQDLSLLHRVALAAASAADFDELLRKLGEAVQSHPAFARFSILLLNWETGELELRAGPEVSEELKQTVRQRASQGFTGRVARGPSPLAPESLGYEVAFPLVVASTVVGAIAAQRGVEEALSWGELQLLEVLASELAVIIEKARLLEEAERQAEAVTQLLRLSQALAPTLDYTSLWALAAHHVPHLVRCDFCLFLAMDHEAGELTSAVAWGREQKLEQMGAQIAQRLSAQAMESCRTEVMELAWPPGAEEAEEGMGTHSLLAVPLRAEEELEGIILLGRLSSPFGQEERRLLKLAASQFNAVLANARLHERLKAQAMRDSLTQLFHHQYLHQRLAEEVERSKRFGAPVSFIMLDINGFKQVNDLYGHAVGDEVLKQVAQQLKRQVRQIDVVGRYGGEEFGIILPQTDSGGARLAAERIRRVIQGLMLPSIVPDLGIRITVSQGIATYPTTALSYTDLLQQADLALYRAKKEGKDRVCVAPQGETSH